MEAPSTESDTNLQKWGVLVSLRTWKEKGPDPVATVYFLTQKYPTVLNIKRPCDSGSEEVNKEPVAGRES